ncbi:MAG: anaerobic sulfatase maturase [Anaerolineae bacterium]|nr:anaerobic sulfatase maturase [Anaerolineae bacterium]
MQPDTVTAPPPAFHIMLKPRGAICNLNCRYCYFLAKERMYPESRFRMPDELLEAYTRQYIEAQPVPEVTFAWQGGEPTLMGLDFFKRAVELQQKYKKPGMRVLNALQTNGTTIDGEWAQFFHDNDFLIGISIDGPAHLHDFYRRDKGGNPTHARVMRGLEFLKQHKAEFNILCTVHAANAPYPLDVYRFFRDELGAQFIQFIPIVERANDTGYQEGAAVTDRSVTGEQYGQFLIAIFDEWVRRDVGRVFVQIFDVALGAWSSGRSGLCVFEETCGTALAMEHNGDLFACDHFVEPRYKLGNMTETPIVEMVASERQRRFGQDKRDTLPRFCRECEVRFVCNGGCPKNRTLTTPDGEPGLNYLCAGYKAFFTHIDRPMRIMTDELRHRRAPANVMFVLAQEEAALERQFAQAKRNDPCPCGSGLKFKKCHGSRRR